MKLTFNFATILFIVFFLTACGDKKIDATSFLTFENSIETLASELPQENKTQFEDALSLLLFAEYFDGNKSEDEMREHLLSRLHGKTVAEVITMASKIE